MGRILKCVVINVLLHYKASVREKNTLLNDNRQMYNSKGKYAWMEMLDIPTTQQQYT